VFPEKGKVLGEELENKKINNELQQFQMGISRVIFEQTLEYILWKAEQYDNLNDLKKAVKEDLKKIHKKNMHFIEKAING